MSRLAYDNTGQHYNVTKILRDDTTLDIDKYRAYSPLFLPYACHRFVLWIYSNFFCVHCLERRLLLLTD